MENSMNYPKSLFYNFLTVYFVNHLLPGIDLLHPMRLPHMGSDLPFAIALGLLNSLIYPICKLVSSKTPIYRIALIAFILNFVVYALLKVLPIGIFVTSLEGYFLVSSVVTVVSIATNYFYMKRPHREYHHHHNTTDTETSAHSVHKFEE